MAGTFIVASKNRTTTKAIEKALKEDHYEVAIAANGVALVDQALDKKPNAVFLGVSLTGSMTGLEAARALRTLTPTENVPIIFLAENAEEEKKISDARLPLADCLVAPFDENEVKAHAAGGMETGESIADLRPSKTENAWMLAILDPLTQLYHRRYMLHRLGYESKRSARYKNPLAVLLVDVDNLKEINKQHGILTGDSVLIEMGQLLLAFMRQAEIIGRNDTQDFLIIAPQITEDGVIAMAQRICKTVMEHHFVLEKLDLHVTVSVGVAWIKGDDLSENLALLGRAEVALTRAKQAGKNRVEVG
ncbi:MAG: diguanylate cyclase [Chloroflexi bacterium]|nr:diguanylate cyclase [Chloroflexota bacterium]